MEELLDVYLKGTAQFSSMLEKRTPGEVTYDQEVVGALRKGLSIKKALQRAGEKYPAKALHWSEETITDIKHIMSTS